MRLVHLVITIGFKNSLPIMFSLSKMNSYNEKSRIILDIINQKS